MSEDNRPRSRSRVPLVDTKRRSRSCDNLDWSSESQSDDQQVPTKETYCVPVRDDAKKRSYRKSAVYDLDGDVLPSVPKPKLVRVKSRKSRRCSVSHSRSFDSLNLLSPDVEWTMKQSDSQRSLHSFASSDDELEKERLDLLDQTGDLSQGENDKPIPSPLDEVAGGPLVQTHKQVAGPIELVAGVSTCKCESKEDCIHTVVWKGLVTEDHTIRLSVHCKDGKERNVSFPHGSSLPL